MALLAGSIEALDAYGSGPIASIFNWPQPELFTSAAGTIGFVRVDRSNMARRPGHGDKEIQPSVTESNHAALRLYLRMGFEVISHPARTSSRQ